MLWFKLYLFSILVPWVVFGIGSLLGLFIGAGDLRK